VLDKPQAPKDNHEINLINWTKPFDSNVWLLVIFTIFLSGLVYQAIEHLCNEREGRPMKQWFADNLVSAWYRLCPSAAFSVMDRSMMANSILALGST
jgi:hypothetical protein